MDLTTSPSHPHKYNETLSKRQLDNEDDDSSSYSAGPSKKFRRKDNEPMSNAMGEISNSMSTMARAFVERSVVTSRKDEAEDSHGIWAKLVAMKLRHLPYHTAEKLKHEFDGMILSVMEDD
jgi:hypothetical protein